MVGAHVTGGEGDLGELVIQSGGQVSAPTVAYIGGSASDLAENVTGGIGRVLVSGAGSSLTVGSDTEGHDNPLFVGYTGQGTLLVDLNAQVTAR